MQEVKKKVFEIEIPLISQNVSALAVNQDALIGRIIKMDLTRTLRGKSLEATIIIKKDGEKLFGEILSVSLIPNYIRRMIKGSISYIEDSILFDTKESKITIKIFMLTRKKVHRSVRKALRDRAKEVIAMFVKEKSDGETFSSILYGEMQRELMIRLKKIYPLAIAEIRMAKIKR